MKMDATITVAITKPVSGFRCDRTTYLTKGSNLDQAHLYAAPDAAVSVKDRTWQHSRQTDEASSARGGRERERERDLVRREHLKELFILRPSSSSSESSGGRRKREEFSGHTSFC